MDLRPQAHEIIRTWLFSTVVRSELEHGALPWSDAAISGWVLDPDRKKMSKSKGNVVTPLPLLEKHGADAVRYWAAGGRPGTDTAFDEGQMKVGRRLAIKVLNASRFVLGRIAGEDGTVVVPGRRRRHRPDRPGHAGAGWPRWSTRPPPPSRPTTTPGPSSGPRPSSGRSATTTWSWSRPAPTATPARPAPASARAALAAALSVLLRLLAPVLPFVTEEVWSWWQAGSIHTAPWPTRRRARPGRGRRGGRGDRRCSRWRPRCSVGSARPRPRPSARCGPGWPPCTVTDTPRAARRTAAGRGTTCATPAAWTTWSTRSRATSRSVEVELADEE